MIAHTASTAVRAGFFAVLAVVAAVPAAAQPLGTFRWQLRPFCNVVTVAITQNGAVYRLEGTDDQCGGGADAASVTGTAFPNADGTIGFGLNIVTAPGGRPLHVDAEIALGTFSGTWRDSAGASGTFALTQGAGTGGTARPLPSALPSTIVVRPDGGFAAAGAVGVGTIPASGPGSRMMWYPGKAAFRAGHVDSTEWDDARVGHASVAMGASPTANGDGSVALGYFTRATGFASTALGNGTTSTGVGSTAIGTATTAGGEGALAAGIASAAAGDMSLAFGRNARADGEASVALGTNAVAATNGSFVFADASIQNTPFRSLQSNQFLVRAARGVYFYSNSAATLGVQVAPNGTQWLSLSDARTKHRFRDLDGDDVLAKIAAMPVTEWSYKEQDSAIRHIGPTAQDFHAAFGLGEDPLRIGTLDADGVAIAGVKAVEARTRTLRDEHEALRQRVATLEQALADALELVRAQRGGR